MQGIDPNEYLNLKDPDGNEVELYVDDPGVGWRNDDAWMAAPVEALELYR
jgi:catechol 2,3-dioxygenase